MTTDLLAVADGLYGLSPAEFTAARDEAAGKAKLEGRPELAQQIRALRKPVAAAWVVNLLVRRKQAEVERLFAIADRLREAQRTGEGAELRELNRAAQAVVPAVVRMAGDLARSAGRPMTEAVAGQVHQTLRAAMADPAAAGAVLSGRMIGPLEATGGESVDVSGAVAIPTSVTSLASHVGRRSGSAARDGAHRDGPAAEHGGDRAAADRAAAEERRNERRRLQAMLADREHRLAGARRESSEAAAALATARAESEDLAGHRDEVAGKLREARAMVHALEDDLEAIDADRSAADRSRRTLEDRAARAERRADQAAEEVASARAELDDLDPD
jgi:hypothetical protein